MVVEIWRGMSEIFRNFLSVSSAVSSRGSFEYLTAARAGGDSGRLLEERVLR